MDCSHRTVSRSGVAQIASSGLSATATLKASTHFRLLHLAPIARTAYAYSGLSLVNMVAVLKRLVRLLSSRGRHLQLDNPPAENQECAGKLGLGTRDLVSCVFIPRLTSSASLHD